MKSRKLKALENRLLDTLRERFADPNAEAPTTLRDQPTEVVFTALQPKKPQEDRSGMMGFGALPEIQDDFDPSLYADPSTVGEQTVESMLGLTDQRQQVQAVPQIAPPEPTREEARVLQAQQQGQQGQQDPRAAIMAALQGAGGGGGQAGSAPAQGGAQQAQRRARSDEEAMQDLLVRG